MTVIVRLLTAAALASALSACATVTRGATTPFTVESEPSGAAVRTSTGFTCPATPCTFKMPRKDAFEITVTKGGYQPSVTKVETKVAGAGAARMAGNVIAGGIIGIGIDATSGAMNDLVPNPLRVTLQPVQTAEQAQAAEETPGATQ